MTWFRFSSNQFTTITLLECNCQFVDFAFKEMTETRVSDFEKELLEKHPDEFELVGRHKQEEMID